MKDLTEDYASYSTLLDSMEHEIVIRVDDNDYQGDSRVLFKDGHRYGLLFFGWGSCSGCDALEACNTAAERTELRDELYKSIEWHTGKPALRKRIETGEWDLKYSYHAAETREFLNKVAEYCGSKKRFEATETA